ncbi:hypothetical protein TIFTF001_030435 [Ficus carica]|uniref:Uncharacterized protein n=1 Tax=Ficus carica TaxID=3494 RepID=A0AA88DT93_FICCA|nr:hypothetical protein TIFTF001_030435 [Ficus carica]
MAMECNQNQNALHIVMFPWLAHGHIMPYFELSKFLAQKGHKISFVSTPKNLNRLTNLIPQNLAHHITLVSLPLPHVDGLPQGAESTSELPIDKVPFLKKANDRLQLGITQFLEDSNDVNWIIHDFACHWLSQAVSHMRIKLVGFTVFNATTFSFLGSPSDILGGTCRQRPEDYTVVPSWMEFIPSNGIAYKLHEITNHWNCMDPEVSDLQRWAMVVEGCHAVIIRSCPEFEPHTLNLLRKLYQKTVIPIGLLPPHLGDDNSQGDERWESLKRWLDNKEENSVVYIALGTELSLSQELMHELAHGLEKSGLPFFWVVNDRPLVEGVFGVDIIPPGFETRVSGRGMVWRGWVPQLRVLAHRSVGGFLTHCGWSSIIEALGLGRALILFPGGSSDQGLNARLLHGQKIGLEIPRYDKTGSFTSDSVAESIRRVMVDREGELLRENARGMKEIFGNVELQNKYLTEFAEFLVKKSSNGTE